jgi:hypothetical protein
MECRVEDGDVRDARERPSSLVDGADRGSIVEWGERGQLPDRLLDPGIEHGRLPESCATVHDAVPDGVDRGRHSVEAPDRLGALLTVDDRQLEARGACVDDQDAV